MPNYTRQFGANISGITAIRLIDESVVTYIATYTNAGVFSAVPLTLSDNTKVQSFMQLNGTGTASYSQEITEAGTVYNISASWMLHKNYVVVMPLLDVLATTHFLAAVADGNGRYMLIGTPTEPMEVSVTFDADAAAYKFELKGQMLTPPLFIQGIFNTQLYSGGTGTV
jgi:hypothetical protein